jgi:hypothetical protein
VNRERAETRLRLLAENTLEQLAAAKPGLVPHAAAGLCARLGVSGHRITARPTDDLPGPWLSMLTRYRRRTPQPAPASGRSVATAVELPELDGARFAILGLHHSDGATMFHLQASGVTPEDDWEYIRTVRPLPVLWIRDSSGRWHTTQTNGYYPTKTTGEVILPMAIVPPLAAGTSWVDMFAPANPRRSAPAYPSTGPEIRARANRPSRRWPSHHRPAIRHSVHSSLRRRRQRGGHHPFGAGSSRFLVVITN